TEGPGAVTGLSGVQLLAMAHLAVFVTAVAFVLWYGAVAGLGSGRAALLCGIAPVAAALTGIATTGHAPALPVWLGMTVVLAGLALGLGGHPEAPGPTGAPTADEETALT